MKATDLMIGDYIQDLAGDLCQVIALGRQVAQVETLTGVHQGDTTRYLYNAEGVPLTQEILEKNGFARQDGDEYYKEVYSYQKRKTEELEQGDVEYYIDLRRHPIHGRFEFEEGFVVGGTDDNDEPYGKCTFECNFIYDIRYVHQLQHALKQHEIDKEIVL